MRAHVVWYGVVAVSLVAAGAVMFFLPAREEVVKEFAAVETTTAHFERSAERKASRGVSVVAVGDIMLGRHVEALMGKYGTDYPFEGVSALLASADVTFGNLEGPIVADADQTPQGSYKFSFKPEVSNALARHNVSIVSLANNHTLDHGAEGFTETVRRLEGAGVRAAGHPLHAGEEDVVVIKEKVQRIAFVALNATYARSFSKTEARELVEAVRGKHPTVFLLVSMHWGDEYEPTASSEQRELAHALIDAGADVVVGHHPHVVQDIEVYNGKPVFYSLGNFIFDQYFSRKVQEGLAVRIEISRDEVRYVLLPYLSARSQPRLMDEQETVAWLERLAGRSNGRHAEDVAEGAIRLPR